MIDVLIPMLGRAHRVQPLVENIIDKTYNPVRITFLVSGHDTEVLDVLAGELFTSAYRGVEMVVLDEFGPGDYARKINEGYRRTYGEWLLLGASDLLFHERWDVEALEHPSGVIGTNDLANPSVKQGRHSTHPLVSRHYIDLVGGTFDQGPGVIYFEGYDHQAVDNELVTAAQARGEWTFARRSHVQHLHPFYDKTIALDETYKRGLAKGKEDRKLYMARARIFREQSS